VTFIRQLGRGWSELVRRFVPDSMRDDPDAYRRAKVVVGFAAAPIPFAPGFIWVYRTIFPEPYATWLSLMIALTVPLCVSVPLILRATGSSFFAAQMLLSYAFVLFQSVAVFSGGTNSPVVFWNVLIPMGAMALASKRASLLWTLICVAAYVGVYMLNEQGSIVNQVRPESQRMLWLVSIANLTALVTMLVFVYEQSKDEALGLFARTNSQLTVARDQAYAASRSKTEFLANVSHELRTPLMAILGSTEILQGDTAPSAAARAEGLARVERSGRHLLAIINDILDISEMDVGRLDLRVSDFAPVEVLREVLAPLRLRAEARALELSATFATAVPAEIRGDPARLKQVLANLIGNALKFTDRGGVRVVVSLAGEPPQLRFEVVDTGVGIPEAALPTLFEPFTQADTSLTRRFGGTGLGLAISHRLAALLGGELRVASREGEGSTFTLDVPAVPPASTGVLALLADPAARLGDAPAQPATAAPLPKLAAHILLVEDGPDNQRILRHFLQTAGAQVAVAENGQIALDKVENAIACDRPFDLILMDLQMPVLDGYSATAELRKRGFTAPIVALTAHAMQGEREKCLATGCDEFATKPITKRQLLELVVKMLADAKGGPGTAPEGGPEKSPGE
jgi:signal transduction histidine kinase/ActR/RegA family two-component response regulator